MIVGRFVLTHCTPVNRFCRHAGRRELLDHLGINLLGVREFLLHEVQACDGHVQVRVKPVLRQITFDSIALLTVGIQDQNCRRPESVESFEPRGMFFYVSFERDESLMNKACDFLIRI